MGRISTLQHAMDLHDQLIAFLNAKDYPILENMCVLLEENTRIKREQVSQISFFNKYFSFFFLGCIRTSWARRHLLPVGWQRGTLRLQYSWFRLSGLFLCACNPNQKHRRLVFFYSPINFNSIPINCR
jgi:hypothetical protein